MRRFDMAENERFYPDVIRRSGVAISAAEVWAMWHLAAHGPITARALAARLHVDPAAVSALFEALCQRAYVQPDRQGVPDVTESGRRTFVALVKAGHEEIVRLIDDCEPASGRADTRVLRRPVRTALTAMPALGHLHARGFVA
jgi:DNA-binding MarR family transcriptional regulator